MSRPEPLQTAAPAKACDVLFVIGSLAVGGAETQLTLLARALQTQGLRCAVFVLGGVEGPLASPLLEAGVLLVDGGYRWQASNAHKLGMLLRAVGRLWRLLRTRRPTVLHAFLPLTNLLGALAGRLALTPLVITGRRALGTHQERQPGWWLMDRLANRLSHSITVNSMAVWRDTVTRDHVDPGRLALIHNGLEMSRFANAAAGREALRRSLDLRANQCTAVMVANLIPYKGHADVLAALARLPQLVVLFVGEDRGIGDELAGLAVRLGVAGRVRFLGRRGDIPELLGAADIGLLASHEEGFSNALLEMMAVGLPVVATDVGGNREALDDGRAGMLVPPRDPDALATALAALAEDGGLRRQLAAAAARRVECNYTVAAMVQAHLRLYRLAPVPQAS